MLISVGRGLSPAVSKPYIPAFKRFTMTSALPPEVTFERASPASVTNNQGKLVSVNANEPRFDHDKYGTPLGLMIEPAVTNKCKNTNVNPVDTNGIITSGDVNGVLSVVNDAAALADAGLDLLCSNGNVFKVDNTLGTTSFTLYIDGKVGNTNPHSLSAYVRAPASTGRVCRFYVGGGAMDINGDPAWTRYAFENETPNSTGRKFTIIVDPGKELYFILNQLEEYPIATSVIQTQGMSATREADRPYIDNLSQYSWFDSTQGYFTCRYSLKELLNIDSYIGVIHDGTSANTIGLRMDASAHVLRGYMRANSTSQFTLANNDVHIPDICHVAGTRWNNAQTEVLSGGDVKNGTITALPVGLNRFEIGARNGGLSPIHGHVQEIEIGKSNLTTNALGYKLQKPSDIVIIGGGQSLMRGHFTSQETGNEDGKQAHRQVIGNRLRDKTVTMIDGSSGGSAACKTSNPTAYWWDLALNTRGPAFDTFYTNIANAAIRPNYVLWAQGEEDSHHIGSSTTRAEYKQALNAIFADMRNIYGDIPVFIQRIGRRASFSNPGGVQAVRDVQEELIAENSWCYEAGETYDSGLFDQVHLNDAGYLAVAQRNAAAILSSLGVNSTGANGPEITNATLNNTTITVTLTHDTGTDFTPVTNIEGFAFYDGTNPIAITSAVQTDATTITLTLASAPMQQTKTLYYGYDDMAGLNTANVVHDNAISPRPLRTTKIIVS